MDQTGQAYFVDPDFGPQHKNDDANDSIYFEEIP